MHIEAKKEASKRPWVAGFVYLREMRSTLEVVMKKGFILKSSTRRLLVVEFFNLQNPNFKGIKFC